MHFSSGLPEAAGQQLGFQAVSSTCRGTSNKCLKIYVQFHLQKTLIYPTLDFCGIDLARPRPKPIETVRSPIAISLSSTPLGKAFASICASTWSLGDDECVIPANTNFLLKGRFSLLIYHKLPCHFHFISLISATDTFLLPNKIIIVSYQIAQIQRLATLCLSSSQYPILLRALTVELQRYESLLWSWATLTCYSLPENDWLQRLPLETRHQIYELLFKSDDLDDTISPDPEHTRALLGPTGKATTSRSLTLLRVCGQIHDEATDTLYGCNILHFSEEDHNLTSAEDLLLMLQSGRVNRRLCDLTTMGDFLRSIGSNVTKMKHIQLAFGISSYFANSLYLLGQDGGDPEILHESEYTFKKTEFRMQEKHGVGA